jgi:hypothetical protein
MGDGIGKLKNEAMCAVPVISAFTYTDIFPDFPALFSTPHIYLGVLKTKKDVLIYRRGILR